VFAAAEKHLAGFCRGVFYGLEGGVRMRPITKWLLGAFAAGTPEIGFAGFDINAVWGFLGYYGCAHGVPLSSVRFSKGLSKGLSKEFSKVCSKGLSLGVV
jgi:hypothetical protein